MGNSQLFMVEHPNNKIGNRKVGFGKGDGTGHYLWRKGQSPQDVKIAMLLRRFVKMAEVN